MNGHMSDESSFLADEDGFMKARCACGWSLGPVPGPEEVADALMDHAYEEGAIFQSLGQPSALESAGGRVNRPERMRTYVTEIAENLAAAKRDLDLLALAVQDQSREDELRAEHYRVVPSSGATDD